MDLIEAVSVDRVLAGFRGDQKLRHRQWPASLAQQKSLLREVGRPVDKILGRDWALFAVGKDELLRIVRPVWVTPGCLPYAWTLGDMLGAIKENRFELPLPNSVARLEREMRIEFCLADFLLIGYRDGNDIQLEDGHNRVTAAFLADVLPATMPMYVGKLPGS